MGEVEMRERSLFLLFIALLLLPARTAGGQMNESQQSLQERAFEEVEDVLGQAGKIDNSLAMIKVRAKAASLLWKKNPDRARALYLQLWDSAGQQEDERFDRREAELTLLASIYPRDRELAQQLLRRLKEEVGKSAISRMDAISGGDPQAMALASLAIKLADIDPKLAAAVLKESLTYTTAALLPSALSSLRGVDPPLANDVAAFALDRLTHEPVTQALEGASYISDYLFPLAPSQAPFEDALASDPVLRGRFMMVAYPILKASLAQREEVLVKEENFTPQALTLRSTMQAGLAATLAALAPQYAIELVPELKETASRLLAKVPPQFANLLRAHAAVVNGEVESNSPAASFTTALARGEFQKAQTVIDGIKDKKEKESLESKLRRERFKAFLGKDEILEALRISRTEDSPLQRMLMLTEVAKAASKKRDEVLTAEVLGEARKTPSHPDFPGAHVRALFLLAAEVSYFSRSDAISLLDDAVHELNALSDPQPQKGGISSESMGGWMAARINDPYRFLNPGAMTRAFSTLGEADFEAVLPVTWKIENKAIQLMARLSVTEKVVEKDFRKRTKEETERPREVR